MSSTGYQTNAVCSLRWWDKVRWADSKGTLVSISTDGAEVIVDRPIATGSMVKLEIDGFDIRDRDASVLQAVPLAVGFRISLRLAGGSWPYTAFATLISLAPVTDTTSSTTVNRAPACFQKLGVGFPCTLDDIETAYYEKVRTVHPDKGGDVESFMDLREAYSQAVEFMVGQ